MKKTYGKHILYPGYSFLNQLNSVIFFTLYFGLYSTLNNNFDHVANLYIINPLSATLIATIPFFFIKKVGNSIFLIKKAR
jgi:hypothetical protein